MTRSTTGIAPSPSLISPFTGMCPLRMWVAHSNEKWLKEIDSLFHRAVVDCS